MHESFLVYREFRYLRIAVLLAVVAVLFYAAQSQDRLPRGNTWLGYTLGTVSALIIFCLLFLSFRKRQYLSGPGSLSGWVSAHVYLGGSLIVLATLHSGFRLGWNVHSLTYVLMLLVIVTGVYGVYAYARYPRAITDNRAGMKRDSMLEQLTTLDRECLVLADQISSTVHATVLGVVEGTAFGGSLWHQLSGRLPFAGERHERWFRWRGHRTELPVGSNDAVSLGRREIAELAREMVEAKTCGKAEELLTLIELVSQRMALVDRIRHDLRYHTLLEFWLYLHVPLAVALLAALLIHIFVVFFYW
jgi:hypothetical protein